jgi:UDP-N-acetylglucosamine 2-epimerase (non-hydrolysing)
MPILYLHENAVRRTIVAAGYQQAAIQLTMLIDIIAGEHSDFMKIAPILEAIRKEHLKGTDITYRYIFTGRFDDKALTGHIYTKLGIEKPHINLETGSGSAVEQTATIMVRYEKILAIRPPKLILLIGDSNAAMGCGVAAKKLHQVDIGHVDAGLRSHDITKPEEVNRIVTDAVTNYHFTSAHSANDNLRKAGVAEANIFFVGNVRADALMKLLPYFEQPLLWRTLALKPQQYIVFSYQQQILAPSVLKEILSCVIEISQGLPIIFPINNDLLTIIEQANIRAENLILTKAMDFLHLSYLVRHAKVIITDSTELQEDSTMMHVPCITINNNKERLETFTVGTNKIIAGNLNELRIMFDTLHTGKWKKGNIPYLWDGHAATRIVSAIKYIK